jgi:hypothetical protein
MARDLLARRAQFSRQASSSLCLGSMVSIFSARCLLKTSRSHSACSSRNGGPLVREVGAVEKALVQSHAVSVGSPGGEGLVSFVFDYSPCGPYI